MPRVAMNDRLFLIILKNIKFTLELACIRWIRLNNTYDIWGFETSIPSADNWEKMFKQNLSRSEHRLL